MSAELPENVAIEASPNGTQEPRRLRARASIVLALAFAVATGMFAAVAELVLHRLLHLYTTNITGAAWLFFGAYWSIASMRRHRSWAPIAAGPPEGPATRILAAYRTTLPRVAALAFAVMVLAGTVDRLWRA